MKKILALIISITFIHTVAAQDLQQAYWPGGTLKYEGRISGKKDVSDNPRSREGDDLIKDGKWQYWHENGALSGEEYYENGKEVGVWKNWYSDGKIKSETNWKSGATTLYYKNGKKHSEGTWLSEKVHDGVWKGYFESGQQQYEGNYVNGQKSGVWKWWDEEGKQTFEITYDKGTKVNVQKY